MRDIIVIERQKCNGCGLCVPNCHEGALQIVDGKAVLVNELACDGLGACIGYCPEGALTIEKREAEPYQEEKVMESMIPKGINTVLAHLKHLYNHREMEYFRNGLSFLKKKDIHIYEMVRQKLAAQGILSAHENNMLKYTIPVMASEGKGCPAHKQIKISGNNKHAESLETRTEPAVAETKEPQSHLSHWPVQMHLVNPLASHFFNSDLLLSADCVAYAAGNFHTRYLAGRTLAIACPKLDSHKEMYSEKLKTLITRSKIRSLTILVMEVPCCSGLIQLAKMAITESNTKIPVRSITISIKGEIFGESLLTSQ